MKKVAIITGTGMDSKTAVHFLLSKGYQCVLTYRRNTSQDINKILSLFETDLKLYPDSSLSTCFMDITDQYSVKSAIKQVLEKKGKIDELYNYAAQSHVGDSFENPVYTMMASGVSVFYILDAIKDLSPNTKVFQASTSEMFGGDSQRCPFNENSEFELRSPYAIAKSLGYNWVKYFRQTYGMFACSAFCFNHSNIYRGPAFYIQRVCLAATNIHLGKQKELVLGNLEFYRDESFSDFCVEAFWKMLQRNQPKDYVIGRGEAFHGEEFLDAAFEHYGLDWKKYVRQDKTRFRPNEVVKLVSNPVEAEKDLNWKPKRIPFKDHIKIMCEYDYNLILNQPIKRFNVFDLYPI